MPDETQDTNDKPTEGEAKPTITIAEKDAGDSKDAKPTITIAEKDGTKG